MVDYVHTTGAHLLQFTSRRKEACFFSPFLILFRPIENGGLRGCCDRSQNSCLHTYHPSHANLMVEGSFLHYLHDIIHYHCFDAAFVMGILQRTG